MGAHFHADGRVTLTGEADPTRMLVLEGYGTSKFDEAAYVAFFDQEPKSDSEGSPEQRVVAALITAKVIPADKVEAVLAALED